MLETVLCLKRCLRCWPLDPAPEPVFALHLSAFQLIQRMHNTPELRRDLRRQVSEPHHLRA